MLLSSLTPDELDRLAAVDPARPGLADAYRVACRREVQHQRDQAEILARENLLLEKLIKEQCHV